MKSYRKPYKPYRIKRKKSIAKNRFFWLTISTLIFIGGIFYLVCFASFFQIKEINVPELQKISADSLKDLISNQIKKKILLFESKSIFLVNIDEIEKLILENNRQVAAVDLKRALPDKLFLEIKQRQPWAIWCSFNYDCYYIDEKGIIFAKSEEIPPPILKINNLFLESEIKLGEKVIEEDLIEKIQKINSKFKENIKIDIEKFDIPVEERLNVKTVEGWEVYFDPKGDLNWQMVEINLVLEKEIPLDKRGNLEYIDLRFSKVYYRMK